MQRNLGEECDDGDNDGGYGECGPMCREGPRCGDGVVQMSREQCDDGVNDGGYGECAMGCRLGPRCGDGTVNGGEQCDDGNGQNGDGCTTTCLRERPAGAR
jgi:cysteine-rich repeat protein